MKTPQLAATLVTLLMVSTPLLPARAGMIITADGVTHLGTVLLVGLPGTEPKLTLQMPGKGPKQFKLADIKSAFLDARGEASREADGVPWSRTEIGEAKRAGIAEINGPKISIRDSSDGFRIGRQRRVEEAAQTDSCCFVFQKLDGDGEIVGRVLPSETTRWARGGFMICEGLDGVGPMAFIGRTADPISSIFFSRLKPNDATAFSADAKNVNVPATWLKLTRAAKSFKAYESLDGVKWNLVGEKAIVMDDKKGVYIGVAATGNAREGTVNFEAVRLTGKRTAPGLSNVGDSRLPDICAVLHDGTVLAGSLDSITDGEAKFKRASGETITIPLSSVGRAQFSPLTRAQAQKFQTTSTGMLTRDGDFLDGDIKDIKPDAVTVSSIAFGLTTMERARVIGLVFPNPTAQPAGHEGQLQIRLSDGSVIRAKKITLEKDQLIIEEPLLGTMKVALREVLSIERLAA
jgi:hypothetical protein